VDAMPREKMITPVPTLKRLGECFGWAWPHKTDWNLVSPWLCKAAHIFEDSGNMVGQCYPFQPQPTTLRFSPIHSLEGCYLQYDVWKYWQCNLHSENLAAWAGKGMVLAMRTRT
jgi:hypothetical protein